MSSMVPSMIQFLCKTGALPVATAIDTIAWPTNLAANGGPKFRKHPVAQTVMMVARLLQILWY